MLQDVTQVRALGGHRLHVCFEDGTSGEIDVATMIEFTGVFEVLRDEAEFARVQIDPDTGTLTWPNGADLDPDVLYAAISGKPIDVGRSAGSGS